VEAGFRLGGRGPCTPYLQIFSEFWAPIVQRPDGTPNFGQIARELAGYHDPIGWASEVYCHVTGGRISKPSALPSAVIAEAIDDCLAVQRLRRDRLHRPGVLLDPRRKHFDHCDGQLDPQRSAADRTA
jgi:hypothetical protein